MEKTKYIVAGNIREYLYYCTSHNLHPAAIKYIGNYSQLKRIPQGAEVLLYGNFQSNPIYQDIDSFREAGNITTRVVMPR